MRWRSFAGGTVEIGFTGRGFAFDNEQPRHQVHLTPFELATRPITNAEFLAFIDDGGYRRPELWLADGWDLSQRQAWRAPLYWQESAANWELMTLGGPRPVDFAEPVCHISYYEAEAFATWAGGRLPTEFEWEHAAARHAIHGTFLESGALHPQPQLQPQPAPASVADGWHERVGDGIAQLFGDVWEWTASPYTAYPGYQQFAGALGEYNGKFMVSQMVLRGGCCVTPQRHLRSTYRNFYYPHQRWLFAGVRLAR